MLFADDFKSLMQIHFIDPDLCLDLHSDCDKKDKVSELRLIFFNCQQQTLSDLVFSFGFSLPLIGVISDN